MTGALRTEQRGPVLLLTIDRPQVRNALDPGTLDALAAALGGAADQDVRAIVLTGAGANCFSSGMDLRALRELGAAVGPSVRRFNAALDSAERPPIVAAVRGRAIGGGFEIVLRCDLVVAGTDAYFALPEVGRGLVPQGGSLDVLPQRLPHPLAAELVLLGERFDARRAARLGLVNRVVPDAYVVPVALELAGRLAAQPPEAVRRSRALLRADPGQASTA